MTTIHLLGLCGSLCRASSHEIILRTAAEELLPADVQLHLHRCTAFRCTTKIGMAMPRPMPF